MDIPVSIFKENLEVPVSIFRIDTGTLKCSLNMNTVTVMFLPLGHTCLNCPCRALAMAEHYTLKRVSISNMPPDGRTMGYCPSVTLPVV